MLKGSSQLRLEGGTFSVHFTSNAWKQVGGLVWEDFERIQTAMHGVARERGWLEGQEPIAPSRNTFVLEVAGFRVAYAEDTPNRVLLISEILRATEGEGGVSG